MFFNSKYLQLSILIMSVTSLVAMESDEMETESWEFMQNVEMAIEIANSSRIVLPEISRSKSVSPRGKINTHHRDSFASLDRELKQDLELMSFIGISPDGSAHGPLQSTLDLFDKDSLLNVAKICAVYSAINEILNLKHSIHYNVIYTRQSELTQTQISTLRMKTDATLNSLINFIENYITLSKEPPHDHLINKEMHDTLLIAAKDYLAKTVKNWHAHRFQGKTLAIRLLFFSGNGCAFMTRNIRGAIPSADDKELQIFAIRETLDFAIVMLDLLNFQSNQSPISCIPLSPEFSFMPKDCYTVNWQ